MAPPLTLMLLGDQDPAIVAHQAIPKALALTAEALELAVEFHWLDSVAAEQGLPRCDGLWCVPGSPYRSRLGVLGAIRTARERQLPFLGTCGGLQYALLEHATALPGWSDLVHGEEEPEAQRLLLAPLSCALIEVEKEVRLVPGTRLAEAAGQTLGSAGFHCRFGLNPEYLSLLLAAGWRVLAWDDAGQPLALELTTSPCHFGTLYQPEREALAGQVPGAVRSWLAAVASGRGQRV